MASSTKARNLGDTGKPVVAGYLEGQSWTARCPECRASVGSLGGSDYTYRRDDLRYVHCGACGLELFVQYPVDARKKEQEAGLPPPKRPQRPASMCPHHYSHADCPHQRPEQS